MAQPLEHVFSPCSTRSSGPSLLNADLVPETLPAARVAEVNAVDSSLCGTSQQSTVVDPDLCSLGQRLEMSLPQDKDPFVTPVRSTRLSPTASTFTPGTESDIFMSLDSIVPFANALSSKLGLSRILWVSSDNTTSVSEIEHWLSMMEVSCGGRLYGTRRLAMRGPGVEIAFTDLRDSIRVKENFDSAQTNHSAEFVSSRHDFSETTGSKAESAERGQVLITASLLSSLGPHEKYVPEVITSFLERYGRLFALANRTFSSDGAFQAVAEFCNVDAAVCAIRTCRDGIAFMGFNMFVEPWTHEAQSEAQGASLFPKMSTPTIDSNDGIPPRRTEAKEIHQTSKTHRAPAFAMYPFMFSPQFPGGAPFMMDTYSSNAQSVPMGPFAPMTPLSPGFSMMRSIYHSPPSPAMTSQYSSSPSKANSAYARPDVRRQGATRVTRSAYGTGNHHNHVDTARIREGIDVRTTIMLRNIPNKVDQAMLKRLVDESSWGKYDFMYLRIDFANDCNVGYAFINFVDPLDIVDFVEARGNQRWNCFKSDKVAEISYATIQGKDCLVQKFRNSSVMLEAPHYRPKLYFTSNGPMPELAGQEEPFPEPDNQSKMKRSCENAEHVGLFTPNAGQHFRDEQRRRRSQYDRGTRLAALEEYDYDAAVNHLCGAD